MKTICDQCGSEIEKSPSHIKKAKHHFCNNKCRGRWISENNRGTKHPFYGKHHTKETIQKIRENTPVLIGENNSHFGKHLNEEHKRKISEVHKGKTLSEEHKRKIGKANSGEKHPLYGKHHSEESKQKMRDARKNVKIPNTYTIPERIFIEMCKKFDLPFHYVGNSSLWIGKKGEKQLNPDFIEANGKKIVVEIFGDYWHSPLLNRSLREDANLNYRKEHYKRHGWDSIFLWESDLKRSDAEHFVLNIFKR